MAVLNQNLNRAFVLSELTPANEISFLDSYKKTLSKCCNDPLRPPRLSDGMRRPVSSGMRYAPNGRRAQGAMERRPAYEKE